MLQCVKKSLLSLYLQYELVTCIYMFEPWEKRLINGFVTLVMALVIFSSFVYLPTYIKTFLQFISPLPMGSPTNTAPSYTAPILHTDKIILKS